jgi:ABC-type branched-subunit amino acid transport system substrate-binding protein
MNVGGINMQRRDFLTLAVQSSALLGLPLLNSRAVAASELAVSAKHVTLASSLGLTGILAGSAADIAAGIQAAFRSVNRAGGINGRELKLLTMDDGYVPTRTADNAKEVIASGSALAFLSGQGTPNHAQMLPLTEAAGVPVVGPITGADSLRQEKFRYTFHVRASYRDETKRLVQQMVGMGLKDLAIVYLDNAYGKEVLGYANEALKEQNIKSVGTFALEVSGNNGAALAKQVTDANPGAVYLITTGTANTAFMMPFRAAKPALPVAGTSVSVVSSEIDKLGEKLTGYAQAAVMPNAKKESLQVVRTYQADMVAIDQGARIGGSSLEGWINAQVMIEGVRRAGRELTRESLRQGLAGIQRLDLGGFMINYASAPFVGSKYIDMAIFGGGGRRM